jgi:hypothetical protein
MNSVLRRKRQLATVRTHTKDLLPVAVKLGKNKLEFICGNGKCTWERREKGVEDDENHITALQNEVNRLRERLHAVEKQKMKEVETRYMIEFKNKLLLEMLAVAQLDSDKNNSNLQKEQVKTEALKFELACLTLSKDKSNNN